MSCPEANPTAAHDPDATSAALVDTVLDALEPLPAARIADAYKWLFQATRGGEHAAPSEPQAREWLARDWGALGSPRPDESLMDVLRPDGALVRVNLRPYKARGGSQAALLEAFLASAATFHGDSASFAAAWRHLGARLSGHPTACLSPGEWERLDAAMRPAGYPAVHHSAVYTSAYAPAYRVLRREEARRLIAER